MDGRRVASFVEGRCENRLQFQHYRLVAGSQGNRQVGERIAEGNRPDSRARSMVTRAHQDQVVTDWQTVCGKARAAAQQIDLCKRPISRNATTG